MPPPIFAHKAFLRGSRRGLYILNPPTAGFYTHPPPSYPPPPSLEGYVQACGGGGCIKFGGKLVYLQLELFFAYS